MRPELLQAYWDVIRDGMSSKEAAERHGGNPGQTSTILTTTQQYLNNSDHNSTILTATQQLRQRSC